MVHEKCRPGPTNLISVCTLMSVLLLSGCTAQQRADRIIIDKAGVSAGAYQVDLSECTAYAEEVRAAEKVVVTAAGGAAVGGVIAAIWGGRDIARGAGTGGVLGGVNGAADASREMTRVLRRCLQNRGYSILN